MNSIVNFVLSSIYLITVCCSLYVIYWLFRWPADALRNYLIALLSVVVGRLILRTVETLVVNPQIHIILGTLSAVLAIFTPFLGLLLFLSFFHQTRFTTRTWQLIFGFLPALATLLFITNPWHNLVWHTYRYDSEINVVFFERTPLFWLFAGYMNLLLVGMLGIAIWGILKFRGIYRRQAIWMTIAMLVPWFTSTIYLAGWGDNSLMKGVGLTPLAFVISTLITVWIYRRYQIFDLRPIAHNLLINHLPDGIIVLDIADRVVEINPAAIKLFKLPTAHDVIGQPLSIVFASFPNLIVVLQGKDIALRRIKVPKLGYLDIRTAGIYRETKALGKLMTFRDVTTDEAQKTALHEAKEIAEASSKVKSIFLNNINHEFHTPLGLIKLGIDTLNHVNLDRDTRARTMQVLNQEVDYLTATVENLLESTRLDQQKLHLNLEPIVCNDLVKQAVNTAQVYTELLQYDHLITLSVPSQAVVMQLDQLRIDLLLRNLLQNAIKYSPAQSTITVAMTQDSGQVHISVTDQGLGLSAIEQTRVFDRFYRGTNRTVQSARGMGLGLSLCQSIALAHGGEIGVTSQLGAGSTFLVTLPCENHFR